MWIKVVLDIKNSSKKAVVEDLITKNFNGLISTTVDHTVSHFVCDQFRVTFQSLTALSLGIAIVSGEYFLAIIDNELPTLDELWKYLPSSADCKKTLLLPNAARRTIFSNYHFVFKDVVDYHQYLPIITIAGGTAVNDNQRQSQLAVALNGRLETTIRLKDINAAIIHTTTRQFLNQPTSDTADLINDHIDHLLSSASDGPLVLECSIPMAWQTYDLYLDNYKHCVRDKYQ